MTPGTRTGHSDTSVLGRAWSAAGLEYGLRVSVCCATSTVLAQWLHHEHWYWLPATTVFLVKPDLGPLASRVVCRAVGTVAGAAVFGASSMLVSGPAPLVATVALCGALLPVATRHFAVQTAVVTVLVLSLVLLGGEPRPPGAGSWNPSSPAGRCCWSATSRCRAGGATAFGRLSTRRWGRRTAIWDTSWTPRRTRP